MRERMDHVGGWNWIFRALHRKHTERDDNTYSVTFQQPNRPLPKQANRLNVNMVDTVLLRKGAPSEVLFCSVDGLILRKHAKNCNWKSITRSFRKTSNSSSNSNSNPCAILKYGPMHPEDGVTTKCVGVRELVEEVETEANGEGGGNLMSIQMYSMGLANPRLGVFQCHYELTSSLTTKYTSVQLKEWPEKMEEAETEPETDKEKEKEKEKGEKYTPVKAWIHQSLTTVTRTIVSYVEKSTETTVWGVTLEYMFEPETSQPVLIGAYDVANGEKIDKLVVVKKEVKVEEVQEKEVRVMASVDRVLTRKELKSKGRKGMLKREKEKEGKGKGEGEGEGENVDGYYDFDNFKPSNKKRGEEKEKETNEKNKENNSSKEKRKKVKCVAATTSATPGFMNVTAKNNDRRGDYSSASIKLIGKDTGTGKGTGAGTETGTGTGTGRRKRPNSAPSARRNFAINNNFKTQTPAPSPTNLPTVVDDNGGTVLEKRQCICRGVYCHMFSEGFRHCELEGESVCVSFRSIAVAKAEEKFDEGKSLMERYAKNLTDLGLTEEVSEGSRERAQLLASISRAQRKRGVSGTSPIQFNTSKMTKH